MDLHLGRLKEMHPFLSASTASEYAFRAATGLARHGHVPGAALKIWLGSRHHEGRLHWSATASMGGRVLDYHRVTEDAAEAITLALVSVAHGWVVRRRLQRGEFADWLLADNEDNGIALEISGIDDIDVGQRRLREKLAQVKRSSAAATKGVCVVELRPPRSRLKIIG
jgi:hypothetical protein